MSDLPTSPDQGIVIKKVTDKEILLSMNGEARAIPNTISDFKKLLTTLDQHSFQAGEKIYNIGEIGQAEFNTIVNQYYQESRTSLYLRIALFVIVPVLAITAAYLLYQYKYLQQPISLTVKLDNRTPAAALPDPAGKLILSLGDKTDTQQIVSNETSFKGIPANFRKQQVSLKFMAPGFTPADTTFIISEPAIVLQVSRNNDLAEIKGSIDDDHNQPLDSVRISALDIVSYTDRSGKFSLSIPFEKQRFKQRLEVYKPGYIKKDVETPVIPNEDVRLVLLKNKKTS